MLPPVARKTFDKYYPARSIVLIDICYIISYIIVKS